MQQLLRKLVFFRFHTPERHGAGQDLREVSGFRKSDGQNKFSKEGDFFGSKGKENLSFCRNSYASRYLGLLEGPGYL